MQTVIECGQLLDGQTLESIRDASVIVEGTRIAYAGPTTGAQHDEHALVIRLPGGTVMPGLIDVHVHVTYDGGPGRQGAVLGADVPSFAEAALRGYTNARRSLLAGYTTLGDLHAPGYTTIAVRNVIESGRLEGPRLCVCGQGLCVTGGHMDKTMLPHELTGRVGVCDTPEGFRQAVRHHIKMGVDLIKINSDVGSYGDPSVVSVQEMSFDEMSAACSEAHKFGRHVAAHTAGGAPLEDTVRAGVDTIEHGHWLTDRAIELMLEHGAYYVPTLIVNTANFWYTREELGVTEDSWDWLKRANEDKWDSLERAHRAGVKIAAELLRLDHEIGTLAPGKLADVIVVDGDPLTDIALLQCQERITHVFKSGQLTKSPVTSESAAGPQLAV